jgi:type III secretion system YopN/LcrE/InvE/MxiC family regulator
MASNIRIQQPGRDVRQPGTSDSGTEISGRRNGQELVVKQTIDVDETIFAARLKVALGISGSGDKALVSAGKILTEQQFVPLGKNQLSSFGNTTGTSAKSTKLAQAYLKHYLNGDSKPKPGESTSEIMQHFMGLQRLANALQSSDEQFVALLTPAKESFDSIDDIAKRLQEAGDDPEKFAQILSEVGDLGESGEKLEQMLKTLRFKPDQLKQKLREGQQLPNPDTATREELLESVQDEIQEFESKHKSTIRASLNSLGAAKESGDPERFIESYNDLVLDSTGFSDALGKFLEKYTPEELGSVLPRMKQALADDLRADGSSTDKIKLESLLTELSFMHISSTLIEMVDRLIIGMKRLYSEPTLA